MLTQYLHFISRLSKHFAPEKLGARVRLGVVALIIAIFQCRPVHADPAGKYLIPSWGDITLVYGPDTDAAMDSERAMDNIVKHWKARGFTGVFLRTDFAQFLPDSVILNPTNVQKNQSLAVAWRIIDDVQAKFDPHKALSKASKKYGFEYWMFHPYIYSDGAPKDVGVEGPGRMIPWSYERRYLAEHPEVITVDREGNKQWMVAEYAYPGARADKTAEFAYMAKTYHPTGIIASMRSESSQLIPPPDSGDQYGFNQIVVDEMKAKYNVDILTDPRFDYKKSSGFNIHDPMVENWRNLRGSHITDLYREIRSAMKQADPNVKFAVHLSGEYVGPIIGNARLEWRKWIDEGIVDAIILPVTFEATYDLDCAKKGYLTDTRNGVGTVTADQVKQYILKSGHPEIKVINSGAPSYFYPDPPQGADAWQCDAWYDVYTFAWYERWGQWLADLHDFGSIKFLKQGFDDFPVRNTAISGGFGDMRYHPDIHSCPGVWYPLGDGSDDLPYVQTEVKRGQSGSAIALTGKSLMGVHDASPDRSLCTGMLDTAIANGKATLSWWLYRENAKNSLTVCFTENAAQLRDVSVRIEPTSGRLSYADGSRWVSTDRIAPVGQWFQTNIDVDLDTRKYSASIGNEKLPICNGIDFAGPTDRTIEQPGVNVPIKVPAYRTFGTVIFTPAEGSRDVIYLDDVLVDWKPVLHFVSPGRQTLLSETFEGAKPGSTDIGKNWRVFDRPNAFFIQNSTSYGPGAQCVQASGGGTLAADLGGKLTPTSNRKVVVDMDLFIRSDKDFPYITPDPTTRSSHSVTIALEGAMSGSAFASLETKGGTWRLWDGHQFKDTQKLVTYDVWEHVQIAVDSASRSYQLVVQPIGELPSLVGQAACGDSLSPDEKLRLTIKPSDEPGHVSCYDNVLVSGD